MKVYTVKSGDAFDKSVKELFAGQSASGPRIKARLGNWPKPTEYITEGKLATLDLEANKDGKTLMVTGLRQCSAVFYLYMKPGTETLSAALAFHSPSGGLAIQGGKGQELKGPLAEAKRVGRKNVDAKDVYVLMAAGPETLGAYDVNEYNEGAIEEHKLFIALLDHEKIPKEHRLIYCTCVAGLFGLSAEGCLGEPVARKK